MRVFPLWCTGSRTFGHLTMELLIDYPQFITATIYQWKHLLKPDKYKEVLVASLQFLVRDDRVIVYAFCILSNHIHLIWQMKPGHSREHVQRDFLKFTAQTIRFDLGKNHPDVLSHFQVNLKDRKYQFWKRNALSVDLFTDTVFRQKLNYIYQNPVKAGICETPEDYLWSSARFYESGDLTYNFLTYYSG